MTRTTSRLASPFPNFLTTPMGGGLTHVRFRVRQAHKHGRSYVESDSSIEPTGSEAEAVPLRHRGPDGNRRNYTLLGNERFWTC
ncbi:hypothetical protein AVEN_268988-1 [Araneus ventricosus]|uniref:Uncharacterized protein n=1 Tax=Araneus ventricosus TaxID=182803 RepID=A0A4Y2HJE4_ARAVE|nr:hypothetical protein AVEN_268988-1 [Araneus ventricosus]